jgi:hypothetical protein
MRVNRLWMAPVWWAVMLAMTRMMRELTANPSVGLLHAETWFGQTTLMVQYWRSNVHLQAYAHARERAQVVVSIGEQS